MRREDGERDRETKRESFNVKLASEDSAMQNCNSLQTATLVDKCVIAVGKMNHVVCRNHGRMDGVDGGYAETMGAWMVWMVGGAGWRWGVSKCHNHGHLKSRPQIQTTNAET